MLEELNRLLRFGATSTGTRCITLRKKWVKRRKQETAKSYQLRSQVLSSLSGSRGLREDKPALQPSFLAPRVFARNSSAPQR